jgi:hypothetical protein
VTIVENKGVGLWEEEASKKVQFIEDLSTGKYEGEDYFWEPYPKVIRSQMILF